MPLKTDTPSTLRRRLLASAAALPAVLGAQSALATNGGAHHGTANHGGHPGHAHPGARGHGLSGLPLGNAPSGDEEEQILNEMYEAAQAEGGRLIVYAGGDTPDQQDYAKNGFKARFPNIDIDIIVDYSKIHDVRVDNQLATDTLVPDVVQLQTLQDFERWKHEGRLLPFMPPAFPAIHPFFRDEHGAWISIGVLAFSFMVNASRHTGRAGQPEMERQDRLLLPAE